MDPGQDFNPQEQPVSAAPGPVGEESRTGETVFELSSTGEVKEADSTAAGSHGSTLTPQASRSASGSRKSGLRARRRGSSSGSGSGAGRPTPSPDLDSDDPLVGEELDGRYRLLEPLGQGGMAAVYKAWHLMLERLVAVKLIRRDVSTNPRFRERFFREAEISTSIVHPNVVQVRDFGETEGGTFYMVMDFCVGDTLAQILRDQGPLEPRHAAEVAVQVLGALGEAHRQDVVHRDIKPENVILQPDDMVKVLDFGLAKVLRTDEDEGLTRIGAVLGTPKYMSPEQAAGQPCDARCDLYSVGVVLYELLSGKLPFDASSSDDMIQAHISRAPEPLSEVLHGMAPPSELEAIVDRALAKKPADRWQSADEFAQALQEFLDSAHTDVGVEVREADFADEQQLHLANLPDEISLTRCVDTREDVEGYRFVVTPESYRRDRLAEFVNQIEIAGRISHPALAEETDAGTYPGGRYYAFVPRVDGQSLHARISEGALPLDVWYRHAKALLGALAKAHDFGTTHLALSSHLISLTPEGPVLHGLGVVPAAQSGWSNPTNDVQDLAFLLLQMLAGAHVEEVGLDLVRQAGFAAAPEAVRPVLEKALGASPFPHAGALLRALQIVDPAFSDAPQVAPTAALPAVQPAPAQSQALVVALLVLVVILLGVVIVQAAL
ncbi:MAG: protein kinase [Planctomycetes bacterium]|nr:protein kinase [Planctomycetota bacterium]